MPHGTVPEHRTACGVPWSESGGLMAVGRKPKPIEQKRMLGNPGRRPLPNSAELVTLPAAIGTPEPHRPLGSVGRELWQRIWEAGAIWIARDVDAEFVQMACEMADERVALRVKVLTNHDPVERKSLRELDK